jgi:hypothetical protein
MPLNPLQHQLFHYHHVNSPNGKTFNPCNMKWHCSKTYIPSYPGCLELSSTMVPTCFAYPSLIFKKKWLEKLIYNNKVWFHLQNYTMKFNTNYKCNMMIWNSSTHKVLHLSPKVYSNDYLLSNTKPTHFKEGINFKFTLHFLLFYISKVGWLIFGGKLPFFHLWFRLIIITNKCLKPIINFKRNLLVR